MESTLVLADAPSRTGRSPAFCAAAVLEPPHLLRAEHERATLALAVSRVARLLGVPVRESPVDAAGVFCIPCDTLTRGEADALGLGGEDAFWGGIVPHAFVGSKLVSHPLWGGGNDAPPGWCELPGIEGCTLPGFSVFRGEDLEQAAARLLREGPVRLKPAFERGGLGQVVIDSPGGVRAWRAGVGAADLARGLVVERDLATARTFSVGFTRLPGHRIAYVGTQAAGPDRFGRPVYAGSCLDVFAGDLGDMLDQSLDPDVREVIAAAMRYDRLVRGRYGVQATRCNYDVIAGEDAHGRRHVGVLEQSWRFGGASMAEVLALERFAANAHLRWLRVETVERYAETAVPLGAVITWNGAPRFDAPTKYARIVDHGCFAGSHPDRGRA